MAIELIAMDLDGTLLLPDHQTVGEDTKQALQLCSRRGIKTVIATGRTYSLTDSVLKQLPFTDYVLYSNGAGLYDCKGGRRIFSDPMPWETVQTILQYLQPLPIYYEFYADGAPNAQSDKMQYFKLDGVPKAFCNELQQKAVCHSDLAQALKSMTVEKLNLFTVPRKTNLRIRAFLNTVRRLDITTSIEDNIEVNAQGVNKGKAMAALCRLLQLKPENVMCFGDGGNDVEMLRFAGCSFAMANATNAAAAAAKYTTASNAQEGVSKAIRRCVL